MHDIFQSLQTIRLLNHLLFSIEPNAVVELYYQPHTSRGFNNPISHCTTQLPTVTALCAYKFKASYYNVMHYLSGILGHWSLFQKISTDDVTQKSLGFDEKDAPVDYCKLYEGLLKFFSVAYHGYLFSRHYKLT